MFSFVKHLTRRNLIKAGFKEARKLSDEEIKIKKLTAGLTNTCK